MKKLLKFLIYLILLVILAFGFLIVYGTISDYKPEPQELIYTGTTPDVIADSAEINLMIWNIGYAGLSEDMDFFYDGGENVYPKEEISLINLGQMSEYIKKNNEIDVWMFQEIDQSSRRSHFKNQYKAISQLMPTYIPTFGTNYDVFFVPLPFTNPMGAVFSGVATYSKFTPENATRYSFPGNYEWPKGLFMLDRCFLVNRYKVSNGKELLLINTHNSAYDDGTLRTQQLEHLKKLLDEEYKKGNYVVVAGDWNQSPAGFVPHFENNIMDNEERMDIPVDYMADWTWAFDSSIPTNRRVIAPYDAQKTLTTVIDYYLLSPNIEKLELNGVHLNFKNTDHNPVFIKIKLKN